MQGKSNKVFLSRWLGHKEVGWGFTDCSLIKIIADPSEVGQALPADHLQQQWR